MTRDDKEKLIKFMLQIREEEMEEVEKDGEKISKKSK